MLLFSSTIRNTSLVLVVIDESRDGAASTDGPAVREVEDSDSIEIQRIGMLPVSAVITGNVFAGWADGHPTSIVNVSHGGPETAGLFGSELPSQSVVRRLGGDAVGVFRFLVISAQSDQVLIPIEAHRKNSR